MGRAGAETNHQVDLARAIRGGLGLGTGEDELGEESFGLESEVVDGQGWKQLVRKEVRVGAEDRWGDPGVGIILTGQGDERVGDSGRRLRSGEAR